MESQPKLNRTARSPSPRQAEPRSEEERMLADRLSPSRFNDDDPDLDDGEQESPPDFERWRMLRTLTR